MLCPLLKCFILEDPSASPFSSIGVVLGRGQGYIEPAVDFINLGFFHSKGKTSKISHATDPKMEEKWSQRSYLFSWHAPLLQYMDELLRHRVEGRRGATRLTYLALAHVCPRSVLVRRGSEGAGRLPTIGLAPMHCTTVSWSLVPVAAWGRVWHVRGCGLLTLLRHDPENLISYLIPSSNGQLHLFQLLSERAQCSL